MHLKHLSIIVVMPMGWVKTCRQQILSRVYKTRRQYTMCHATNIFCNAVSFYPENFPTAMHSNRSKYKYGNDNHTNAQVSQIIPGSHSIKSWSTKCLSWARFYLSQWRKIFEPSQDGWRKFVWCDLQKATHSQLVNRIRDAAQKLKKKKKLDKNEILQRQLKDNESEKWVIVFKMIFWQFFTQFSSDMVVSFFRSVEQLYKIWMFRQNCRHFQFNLTWMKQQEA